MKLTRLLVPSLSPLLLIGALACSPDTDNGNLSLTYISGHLGNDWSCPGGADGARKAAEAPGLVAGDCDAEASNCGAPANCETASLTIRVQNATNFTLTGISVAELELQVDPPLQLDVLSVEALEGRDVNAPLASGEEIRLRINFRAPDSQAIDRDGVPVRVLLQAQPSSGGSLTTPALQVLPVVAT